MSSDPTRQDKQTSGSFYLGINPAARKSSSLWPSIHKLATTALPKMFKRAGTSEYNRVNRWRP